MREEIIDMISGNCSGWAAVAFGQPLDMVKTKLQLGYQLSVDGFKKIYEMHGLRFFYRGASSVFLFVGFIVGSEFLIFEVVKKYIEKINIRSQFQLMLAGSLVGLFSSIIYTPMEYAKIHTQIGNAPNGMGSARMIFHVLWKQRLQGLRKLYKGYPLGLLRESGGTSLYFGSFHILMIDLGKTTREQATLGTQLGCAFAASSIFHFYSYPIDTIKTWVQSGKSTFKQLVMNRFWQARNFRVGYAVAMARGIIMDTTNFTVYENIRRFLLRVTE